MLRDLMTKRLWVELERKLAASQFLVVSAEGGDLSPWFSGLGVSVGLHDAELLRLARQ